MSDAANKKAEDFVRLGAKRVEDTADKLRIVSNLSGPSYHWTPEQVMQQLYDPLLAAILEGVSRFREAKLWRENGGEAALAAHPVLSVLCGLAPAGGPLPPTMTVHAPIPAASEPEPLQGLPEAEEEPASPTPFDAFRPATFSRQPIPIQKQIAAAQVDDTLPVGEGEFARIVRRGDELLVIAQLEDRIAELEGRKPKAQRPAQPAVQTEPELEDADA